MWMELAGQPTGPEVVWRNREGLPTVGHPDNQTPSGGHCSSNSLPRRWICQSPRLAGAPAVSMVLDPRLAPVMRVLFPFKP